ncbi:hypothetical protein PC129_g23010 [Phytophthora cactorum]|uniref:Uncharacterized protein n=1 Tax=Phytophthora cactorum TaxID=29920 RepID=A0A8T1LC51_9STRA|nr:hypothetical protein Pcac1_g18304 [Phytophthora cactorum]KAG2807532.1 hypothetical protein PC112_g17357 [Phytophthora cactorum]KAG2876808.1 hypothetical protein PC114_g23998 [Phytophthora cactorum]KAG2893741.1 hypothetical protein PC117_g23697 [Phytophthora cactorum]KAG2965147.1 hypothetical protein PC119_g25063 [Phytophthora cactorum]
MVYVLTLTTISCMWVFFLRQLALLLVSDPPVPSTYVVYTLS